MALSGKFAVRAQGLGGGDPGPAGRALHRLHGVRVEPAHPAHRHFRSRATRSIRCCRTPALAGHPPFLYSGYVGFSVVFSLSVAALVEGRVDPAWARWIRPWTLAAWSLPDHRHHHGLLLGLLRARLGRLVGRGDPVENASFMPWLLGTALLHSAAVTEEARGPRQLGPCCWASAPSPSR